MKFGKVLQKSIQLSKKDWETSWIDYKKLKGIVKDCVRIDQDDKLNAEAFSRQSGARDNVDMATIEQSPDEAHYFRTLRTEMRKITEFYISQQVVFVKATNKIVSDYQEMQKCPKQETKTKLMAACVKLYKELLLFENYAVINHCAISKILKKHDKWTGYRTRSKFLTQVVAKQPFSTCQSLLTMISTLEKLFTEATGLSMDDHESKSSDSSQEVAASAAAITLLGIHSLRDESWQVKRTEDIIDDDPGRKRKTSEEETKNKTSPSSKMMKFSNILN